MSRRGKLDPGNRKKRKRKNLNGKDLSLAKIEFFLSKSKSYLGAIYLNSLKNFVVKSHVFSFLVYCNNHWFALYSTPTSFEIFDSLGFMNSKKCFSKSFLDFLSNQSGHKNLKASHTLQPTNSHLCGVYALYFILQRDNGYSFDDIMANFSANLNCNDSLMSRFWNKLHV